MEKTESQDLPERPELQDRTESQDLLELPGLPGLQDRTDRTESQDLPERPELQDLLDLQVKTESQDRQVPLERLELRDRLETMDLVSTFLVTCLARGIFQFQATQERRT